MTSSLERCALLREIDSLLAKSISSASALVSASAQFEAQSKEAHSHVSHWLQYY
jgi:hypothetical protein